jgi:hypothetical protein
MAPSPQTPDPQAPDPGPPGVKFPISKIGIVREITGKQRDRVYVYSQYVKILDEGTHPLPR